LYARKRKKGESAQSLCFDIRRLLALGFPGECGKMAEIVGRDCFLNSLDNPQLRIKILELQPANLDEALNHVCRLEAYESLLPGGAEGNPPPVGSNRVRVVKPEKPVGSSSMEQKIKQLEIEQVSMRREIQQASADAQFWRERALAAEASGWGPRGLGYFNSTTPMQPRLPPFTSQPPPGQFGASVGPPQAGRNPNAQPFFPSEGGNGRGRRDGYVQNATAGSTDRIDPDVCRLCRGRGHWARECPNRDAKSAAETQVKTNARMIRADGISGPSLSGGVSGAQSPNSGGQRHVSLENKTYLCVSLATRGENLNCLVDSGCFSNLVPYRYVAGLQLSPSSQQLVAMNGSNVRILGSVRLPFMVGDQSLVADFLVADDIPWLVLGFSFLSAYGCRWQFREDVLEIRGRGHVLVCEPRESGVTRANAMQGECRTFACPFCPVVKGSKMAFRVHLGLHQNSDLRTVRQVDGSFKDQVIRLFGRELGQWVDCCRCKNRNFGPRRRAPRGRAEFSRETATRNNSTLPVESAARQIVRVPADNVVNSEPSGSRVSSSPVVSTSVGQLSVAVCPTELPTVRVESQSASEATLVKTPVSGRSVQSDDMIVGLSVPSAEIPNSDLPANAVGAEHAQPKTQAVGPSPNTVRVEGRPWRPW